MENKNIGWFLLIVSILIMIFTFFYSNALDDAVRTSCFLQHGDVESCEMFDSVTKQTYFSLAIAGVLLIVSLFLIFSKPDEKVVVKRIKEKSIHKEVNLSAFRPEEKQVYNLVKENGAIFQAD